MKNVKKRYICLHYLFIYEENVVVVCKEKKKGILVYVPECIASRMLFEARTSLRAYEFIKDKMVDVSMKLDEVQLINPIV